MSENDIFTKMIEGFFESSKQIEAARGGAIIDERNEIICLKLYDDGWVQDGFDYTDSQDIIIYWKKGDKRKKIRMIPEQQRRWLRELDRRKKVGELK